MEALKERARARGLWNLFLSRKAGYKEGVDLTNVEVSLIFLVLKSLLEGLPS